MRPGSSLAGALWGFAEATAFVIVPDVLLSSLALRDNGKQLVSLLRAACAAALAASAGGLLVWTLARHAPETARTLLLVLPGISETSFETAKTDLEAGLLPGLLIGAFSGLPYKVLAAEAGFQGTGALALAAVTPLARLPRFLLVGLLAALMSALVGDRLDGRAKLGICLLLWLMFYLAYFTAVGW